MPKKKKAFKSLSLDEQNKKLFKRACDCLSYRDHSRQELKSKLEKKFPEATLEQIEEVLDQLGALGLQNDEVFTVGFIRRGYMKKHGPRKINYKLKRKGITQQLADDKMSELDLDFEEKARYLVNSKYSKEVERFKIMDFKSKQKLRQKIYRLLLSRGFAYKTVMKVINDLR